MNKQPNNTSTQKKLPKVIAKGCGCFTVFFLVFFIWGIWSTITSYSSLVEVVATVTDIVEEDTVFMDARYHVNAIPVVSYRYLGNQYTDTLHYKANDEKILQIGNTTSVLINPDQPQFSVENSTSTYYFYLIFLILAIISFVGYRLLTTYTSKAMTKSNVRSYSFPKSSTQDNTVINAEKSSIEDEKTPLPVSPDKTIKEAKPWFSNSIAFVLIAVGFGMGYYKYDRVQTAKVLNEKGVQIKGIVTEVERGRLSEKINRRDNYTISYTWEAASYNYKTSSKFSRYNINEELVLKINPDKPSQAMLLSDEDLNRGSYLFALSLIVVGILIINYSRKKLKSNNSSKINY